MHRRDIAGALRHPERRFNLRRRKACLYTGEMKPTVAHRKRIRLVLKREIIVDLTPAQLMDVGGGLRNPVLDTCDMGPASCNPT